VVFEHLTVFLVALKTYSSQLTDYGVGLVDDPLVRQFYGPATEGAAEISTKSPSSDARVLAVSS